MLGGDLSSPTTAVGGEVQIADAAWSGRRGCDQHRQLGAEKTLLLRAEEVVGGKPSPPSYLARSSNLCVNDGVLPQKFLQNINKCYKL